MHVIVATGFRVSVCVRVLYVLASIKRQESPAAGQLRPNLGGRAIHAHDAENLAAREKLQQRN